MHNQFWQGTLVYTGHWTAQMAASLDCPLYIEPSMNAADGTRYQFRPYSQWTYEVYKTLTPAQQASQTYLNVINWPRTGRNFWLNRHGGIPDWTITYLKLSNVPKPSQTIELSDMEPVWWWGGASTRINYNFSSNASSGPLNPNGDLAASTHDAKPDFCFVDGHVDRPNPASVYNNIFFWGMP